MKRWLLVLAACRGGEPAAPQAPDARPVVRAPDAAPSAPDAAPAPATLEEALAALRAAGLDGPADAIAARVAQRQAKMKLSEADGLAAALAVGALAADGPLRELAAVMPRSTVELARAVRERGVDAGEARAIATYLREVVRALDFERLAVFDESHSHVTGRDWPEIDYTGEGMTWQGQRREWRRHGVVDFKTRASIHAYFVGAERLPHWRKVYRPRGRMADVRAE